MILLYYYYIIIIIIIIIMCFMSYVNGYTESGNFTLTTRLLGQSMNNCFCFCFCCFSTYIVAVFVSYPATKWLCLAGKCRVPQKLDNVQSTVGSTYGPQSIGRETEICLKANPKGYAKFIRGHVTCVPYNNKNNKNNNNKIIIIK